MSEYYNSINDVLIKFQLLFDDDDSDITDDDTVVYDTDSSLSEDEFQ